MILLYIPKPSSTTFCINTPSIYLPSSLSNRTFSFLFLLSSQPPKHPQFLIHQSSSRDQIFTQAPKLPNTRSNHTSHQSFHPNQPQQPKQPKQPHPSTSQPKHPK
ncbi:hypothetical protein GE21DRAFT_1049666 [Neurospora crassa]|nr:hypothetical protein GE21DRAFT_1049666 [Neurospora crassa]